jgi:5'-3' exonuclease
MKAPGEAEATCCKLVEDGLAYGVVTEDMDALPFGAHVVMVKNLFNTEGAR